MQLNGGKAENRKKNSVLFCHNIVGSELLDTVFTLVIIKPKFYTHSCYPSTFFLFETNIATNIALQWDLISMEIQIQMRKSDLSDRRCLGKMDRK